MIDEQGQSLPYCYGRETQVVEIAAGQPATADEALEEGVVLVAHVPEEFAGIGVDVVGEDLGLPREGFDLLEGDFADCQREGCKGAWSRD